MTTEPTDAEILAHEQRVKEEEALKAPLIGDLVNLSELRREYENGGSAVYLDKIDKFCGAYRGLRRTRGDGNCFYRAVAFSYLEQSPTEAKNVLANSREDLRRAGFQDLAFEDFYEELSQLFENTSLVDGFRKDTVSNSIVIYLRFLSSAYLKLHRDEYAPFIFDEGGDVDMDAFCARNVEAWGHEADHLQITALSKALGIDVEVVYLDSSTTSSEATVHMFKADDSSTVSTKPIVLLFRPGHYDILYKNA